MTSPFRNRRPSRTRRRAVPAFLCGIGVLACSFALGNDPDNDIPVAVPLLDRSTFDDLAAQSLSTDSPGAGDDLQQMKAQRFRDLKAKLEELSGLLDHRKPTASSGSPHPDPAAAPRPPAGASLQMKTPHTTDSTTSPHGSSSPDSQHSPETDPPALEANASSHSPGLLPGESTQLPPFSVHPYPRHIPEESHEAGMFLGTASGPSPSGLPPSEGTSGESPAITGQIDRFALANSLFGAGEIESCLNVLKQTDLKSLSREDQLWVSYLQACCHRRAGRIDEARQLYRKIMVAPEADWMKDASRWWLENLDSKQTLRNDLQRLVATLTAWEVEIGNLR